MEDREDEGGEGVVDRGEEGGKGGGEVGHFCGDAVFFLGLRGSEVGFWKGWERGKSVCGGDVECEMVDEER